MKLLIIAPFDLRLREGTSIRVTNLVKASTLICEKVFLLSQFMNDELKNINNLEHVEAKPLQARYHFVVALAEELSTQLSRIISKRVLGEELFSTLENVMKNVNIVHVHWLIFRYIPKVINNYKPVIIDLHGLYRLQPLSEHSLKSSLIHILGYLQESLALRDEEDVDAFTVPSEALKLYLVKDLGISSNKVFVVPDAVDEEIIELARNCDRIEGELNSLPTLPSNSKVIAYTGTISSFHGFLDLVKAVKMVGKKYGKELWFLLITPNKGQLSKFTHLLPKNMIILENIPRKFVPCILRKTTVTVLPHRAGTQFDYIPSNKIYDYMLAGRPIVAYETLATAKTLETYPMKIFAKANSPHDLAQGIIQALELWSATEPKPMFNVPTIKNVEKALDSAYKWVLTHAA